MSGTSIIAKFSMSVKVKLEFTLVLLNPFLKTLDPDQLVSFRSHLFRIQDLHGFPH